MRTIVGLLALVLAASLTGGLAAGTSAAAEPDKAPPVESAQALRDRLVAASPVGSSGYVDPATGQVVLRVAGTTPVTTDSRVRVTYGASPVRTASNLFAGQAMESNDGLDCTTGFMTWHGSPPYYMITAGHCVADGQGPWWRLNGLIGPTWDVAWPGDDYGRIRVSNVSPWQPGGATVFNTSVRRVLRVRAPYVGDTVCKVGATTGTTCGPITAVDVTVQYHDGIVYGLAEATPCVAGGDSGGPLLWHHPSDPGRLFGVGITSGYNGLGCSDPAYRSYFQPLDEVMSRFGLTLVSHG